MERILFQQFQPLLLLLLLLLYLSLSIYVCVCVCVCVCVRACVCTLAHFQLHLWPSRPHLHPTIEMGPENPPSNSIECKHTTKILGSPHTSCEVQEDRAISWLTDVRRPLDRDYLINWATLHLRNRLWILVHPRRIWLPILYSQLHRKKSTLVTK